MPLPTCCNLVPARPGVMLPLPRVRCQRPIAGVWDNYELGTVGRFPLCQNCNGSLAIVGDPVVTAEELPRLIAASICWCHLRSEQFEVPFCPQHGTIPEED